MNATRPKAGTEYSSGPSADSPGSRAARAAAALIIGGFTAAVVGALLPAQRTFTIARRPVLVHSVTTGRHDGWTIVLLAVAALVLLVLARRTPQPRAAFAGVFALGLCALAIALIVDGSGIHSVGAVRVAGGLVDAEIRPGVGLAVEAAGALSLTVGGLTGALLGPSRSRRTNHDATHPQQTRE